MAKDVYTLGRLHYWADPSMCPCMKGPCILLDIFVPCAIAFERELSPADPSELAVVSVLIVISLLASGIGHHKYCCNRALFAA